jgi:hypothetical protein
MPTTTELTWPLSIWNALTTRPGLNTPTAHWRKPDSVAHVALGTAAFTFASLEPRTQMARTAGICHSSGSA